MKEKSFVIGVDFGTDSVRTIIVNAVSGEEISASLFYYPRWKAGKYCNPSLNQFRQHPMDYLEGLEYTIRDCVSKAGAEVAGRIKAIAVDTTGSSPVAVDQSGTPLALLPEFAENPNAMFVLWKDHTSVKEAAEINRHAKTFPSIICNSSAAFIPPNGSGQNYYTYCVKTQPCGNPVIPGWNIATGFHLCSPAAQPQIK